MKVYEVQKEYLGSYDKVEVFSSKKKAIDFILSQGECLHIVVGRGMRSPYFVYRDYVTEEKWAKLVKEGTGHYYIYKDAHYRINVINVK